MRINYWHVGNAWGLSLPVGVTLVVAAVLAPLIGHALAQENWQMLAILGVIAAVPVVIRWPVISTFGLYAFLVPFDAVAVLGGGTLTKLLGMAAAGVLLGSGIIERRMSWPPTAAVWWALLLLWTLMGAAWTVMDPSVVIPGMQTIASLFLLYIIAVSIRVSARELVWVCTLTVLGAMLAAGWSLYYGVGDAYDPSVRDTAARQGLAIGEHVASLNTFAATLLPALALALGGLIGFRSLMGKLLSMMAAGVISAGIFLTMSRAALLAIAAMITVFLYRFRARWQILLAACLLITVVAIMPAAFFNRILAVADTDTTGSGRTRIWSVGVEALANHWLVGAGYRSFMVVYGHTVPLPLGQAAPGAHNLYLGTWVELGVVGLAFMLGAIACHLLAARRAHRRTASGTRSTAARATEAACYGVLVYAFFGDPLGTKFFWLIWILLAWSVQVDESDVSLGYVESHRGSLRSRPD